MLALHKHNRWQLLERIVDLCNSPRIQRVVFQWVRGHRGILPNHYADAIAISHLDNTPVDLHRLIGQPNPETDEAVFQQRATLVRYEINVGRADDAQWQVTLGNHIVMRMARVRLARWSALALAGKLHDNPCQTEKTNGLSLLDWRRVCLQSRAGSYWAPVFRHAGRRAGNRKGSGSTSSDTGAVMMVCSTQFGLPADYSNSEESAT